MDTNLLINNDLVWLAIPISTDNLGNEFALRNHYATAMPASWMLQELAALSQPAIPLWFRST